MPDVGTQKARDTRSTWTHVDASLYQPVTDPSCCVSTQFSSEGRPFVTGMATT